ncbi:MAG: hypothetical protein IKC91_03835 [Clostridia bacterium]|nr:hypothetical protein [Clostridia bacterium]
MEKFYSCTLQFPTRYADFNFQDRLKLSSFLNFMQEAAGISGNELGCGSHYLWPRGLGFILTHNYLELYKDVEPEELLTVKTFPLQPKHVVIERQYEFYNPAGEKLAAATSRWCIIDFKQNKFLPISALEGQDFSRYTSEKSIDFNAWKLPRFSSEGLTPSYTVKIGIADCDHYKHVNNIRYADFCMNCFSLQELESRRIKSFQINYEEQCVEGEELSFYRIEQSPDEYYIFGCKANGKRFMGAKIAFS